MRTKRISLVIYVEDDEQLAKQIMNGTEAFLKTNYGVKEESIESHFRTIADNRRVKK